MNDTITKRTYASLHAECARILQLQFMLPPGTPITDATLLGDGVPMRHDERRAREASPNDLGLDYLDKIEMVMAIEDHFGLQITSEEETSLKTFGQMVDLIAAKADIPKESSHAA
jgi:acyl carrier protein